MSDDGEPEKLRLGGMALRNGLLVHGPTHWAAAVRTRARRRSRSPPAASRGCARSTACRRARRRPARGGLRRHPARQARAAGGPAALPGPRACSAWRPARRSAGRSCAAACGRRRARRPRPPSRSCPRSSRCAAASSRPTTASSTSRSPPTRQGDVDAADAAKEHDRCGSHLVAPMLAANVAGTVLLRQALERPSAARRLGRGARLDGVAVEVFAWSRAPRRHPLAHALRQPGLAIQRAIGTREPTSASSRWARPRSPRSCASRAEHDRR